MSQFSATLNSQEKPPVLQMAGPIDENAALPDLSAVNAPTVVFDLGKITHINSIGIKSWIQWLQPYVSRWQMEFINVPKSIVFQMNMVKNFLPAGAKVLSFFLPLYCESEDRDTSVLICTGKDLLIQGDSVKVVTPLKDLVKEELKGLSWEIDVIEKKYFRFLVQD